jgi:hypothetical protein
MKHAKEAAEPPSSLRPPIFLIGRDSQGNWVAQEQSGMRGGLFVDRAGALKFVKAESGRDPYVIVWFSGILELDTSTASIAASEQRLMESATRRRRVA